MGHNGCDAHCILAVSGSLHGCSAVTRSFGATAAVR
jgi:hypothetical protein